MRLRISVLDRLQTIGFDQYIARITIQQQETERGESDVMRGERAGDGKSSITHYLEDLAVLKAH